MLTRENFNKKNLFFLTLQTGLGTDFQEITTNIVLLGDHKQLGAVVSSDIASRLGLGEICVFIEIRESFFIKSFLHLRS
jgi:hypothetical protein